MAKARLKPEELLAQGRPSVATLPGSAPASSFLDPNVAQAKPQGSELYNLGTVQQAAASTRDANMFNPSYLQEPQNYPTGAEGGIPQPQGANPLLYPTAAETQPKLKARLKPNEALALAEVSRPRRKSPDEIRDELAVGMYDPSQTPLPQDLWSEATQRRSQMIREGRLPMEFGEIDSLADGLVWTKDAAYGVGSYILGTLGDAAASLAADPVGAVRQLPATIGSATQRTATELGLQTYQDTFNLTHEPKYRVKETGEFVAVNKTGLPLFMPAASGGNNVISADGIIDLRAPEQGIRAFAEQGKTLVPVTEQDIEDYRYGQYADRMAMGAQSLEAQNFRAPSNLSQQVLAAMPGGMPLAALLAATDPGGTVGPNQAQAEIAVLAAQSAIPAGAASRSWGISRRVAGGLSKVAGAAESTAGFFPDVDTALRAKFVKTVTSGTSLDAGAQRTALQAAIDGSKTLGIASGAYAAATGLSSIEGVPGELKQAAWTAANLYSGYKGGMFVARQLRSASGFAKTVLKEVADPAQGLDVGARMRVAANPDVPDFVRSVLRSPSSFRAVESTPARLAKNQALSPAARAVFSKLSDYRFVQAARLAKDTAAGVPKGMVANVPFAAGAFASDDPERGGQMLAAGGSFGALGGAAGRFTGAKQRSAERAEGDIARLLVDIQAGNELSGGLGGDIMRNRIRPGTQFQDGPGGFVVNPDREVSSFLTEVEMAGGDVSAFVRGKSLDELSQWAAYQGFFRDKVDLVPLNAADFKLNAEANGQNGAGAYFLQPSEGRRARIFVNAESRRNGLAPHEYGHAVLRGGALSPDQIDAVHAEVNSRYAPDALRNMAGEYAATIVRAENTKQGIDIEPSPAAIAAKVKDLSQNSMIKGSADGLDWLREEIFAEEFRNANIDMNRARRNIPPGANPVSFFENLLGAQSRALNMAGIDIDPQTGKPMGRDQIFKENRVAAGDPVVMKNYGDYVKQWKRWINDPTHEADPGALLSKTGNLQDTANSPNVTWKDYGRGRMETEFAVKNPDGSVTPKNWNKDIKPTVKARQQAVREMSNRSKEVAAADDQTFGMRRRRDGRLETSGRRLPDSFFFIPQYKPFHDILRKINAADDAGETLQVRFFAKGKSKDVFKDGVKNTSAVNREAQHGNFVAKKDGTLMWGWLDMTQFRNRAMKAIADKNPALAQYDWNLKAIMDDLPVHLTDQRRGKGGAFSVGSERANILNGLIGIGDGPLVGAFGKGTAYKTIHLDSIDAVVPTGKAGGEFDVYRANRNAMPDDPKPPVDMETDINNNRMPSALPQSGMAMPDAAPMRKRRVYRGVSPDMDYSSGDQFWSTSKEVAENYAFQTQSPGRIDTSLTTELPQNLYRATNKDDLRDELGIKAKPYSFDFDTEVKAALQARGYDGVRYNAGTDLGGDQAMELHIFGKTKPSDRKRGQAMPDIEFERQGFVVKGYHGGRAGYSELNTPAFVASSPDFAKWYAGERGDGTVYDVRINPSKMLDLTKDPRGATLQWLKSMQKDGIKLKLSGDTRQDGTGAWSFESDLIRRNSPYDGGNALDMVYAPEVQQWLRKNGYDGVHAFDTLENTEAPVYALVNKDAARLVQGAATDGTRGQAMPDISEAPPFYLKSSQALDAKVQGKAATVDQIKAILTNPQNGIKAEELKWTGVMQEVERLAKENNGKVPKDALLRYLAEDGAVRFEEVTMRGAKKQWTQADIDQLEREAQRTRDFSAYERAVLEYEDQQLGSDANNTGNQTQYAQWQLDGGENYREVVLAMPLRQDAATQATIDALNSRMKVLMDGSIDLFKRGQTDPVAKAEYTQRQNEYVDISNQRDDLQREAERGDYQSSHFDTPNYVAHMRLNDRVDAKGKQGLFIEELQNDRANSWVAARDEWVKKNYPTKKFADINSVEQEKAREFARSQVSVGPFTENQGAWISQLFKRALRDAVDSGKDWIGWTTGETQAARFNLSKHVDEVVLSTSPDMKGILLEANKDGAPLLRESVANEKEIERYVGKELAKKLLEAEPTQIGKDTERRISGDDLKVGGEDKINTYDRVAVNEISKYVKQWGGQVEKSGITVLGPLDDLRFDVVGPDNRAITAFETMDKAKAAAKKAGQGYIVRENPPKEQTKIWRVNITPQMREGIKKAGQALFMPDVSDIDTTKFTVAYRGGPSGKGDFPGTFVSTSQEAASQYGDVRAVGVPRGLKVLSIDDDAALQLARQYEKKYPADELNDDLAAGDEPIDLFMFPRPEWTQMLKQKGYQATQVGEDLFVFDGVKLSDKQAAVAARGQAMPDVAPDIAEAMPRVSVDQPPLAEAFSINTTGDVVTGDVIQWEEGVFTSSKKPKFLGNRTVRAVVVKDSYGSDKQQHTFTILPLSSSGTQPIAAGKQTTRKGRNIYRNGTMRMPWINEDKRQAVANEKHARGDVARAARDRRKSEF